MSAVGKAIKRFFPVEAEAIAARVSAINPVAYAKSRNFLGGSITYLSPYFSRGVLTLPEVFDALARGSHGFADCEKLIQELCWREYYLRVWEAKGDGIFQNIRQAQWHLGANGIPHLVLEASTGILALDREIQALYETGYMHNHARMYLSGLLCNAAGVPWQQAAAWLYYHLLDGDLASNALSWQWIAASFSSKPYLANQENINRYFYTDQKDTVLDLPYEELFELRLDSGPWALREYPSLPCVLPASDALDGSTTGRVFVSNVYTMNLVQLEAAELGVLLLEPSFFSKFPMSPRVLDWMVSLARSLFPSIRVVVGEFADLRLALPLVSSFSVIEHPSTRHFPIQVLRLPYPYLVPEVSGFFPSFFSYWNKIRKTLVLRFKNFA